MSGKAKLIFCVHERISGPSCRGANLVEICRNQAAARAIDVDIDQVRCFGQCANGPVIKSISTAQFYYGMSEDKIDDMLTEIIG